MRDATARAKLKAKELVRRYSAWMAVWLRRGADRDEAHQRSLREMGLHWRELARAERLAD